jgi:drug/metabolite transporter (DMT)-like permease
MNVKSPTAKHYFLLLMLGFCWGPSFLFIKVAVQEIPPLTMVAARVSTGAFLLFLLLKLRGEHLRPHWHAWPYMLVNAVFSAALPFFLISAGEKSISSSLAAIINATTPMFTALFAHFYIRGEHMHVLRALGIALGFTGILFIFLPAVASVEDQSEWGAFLVLVASICYAIGVINSKKNLTHIPSIAAACGQLILAAAILIPAAFFFDAPLSLPVPSFKAMASVFGLALLGTATAFALFNYLAKETGANFVSSSTLLFPVIGVCLGWLILGEELSWNAIGGSALIFLGLAIANGLIGPRRRS